MNKRIQQYRLEAGLSVEDLADRSGMSYSTIRAIESGDRAPSIETLKKLQAVLQMDLHWVLVGEELE